MDPFTLAVNILAVNGAAGQLFKLINSLWSLRNAPTQALQLMNEVSGPIMR
jgi:hypothetical protein